MDHDSAASMRIAGFLHHAREDAARGYPPDPKACGVIQRFLCQCACVAFDRGRRQGKIGPAAEAQAISQVVHHIQEVAHLIPGILGVVRESVSMHAARFGAEAGNPLNEPTRENQERESYAAKQKSTHPEPRQIDIANVEDDAIFASHTDVQTAVSQTPDLPTVALPITTASRAAKLSWASLEIEFLSDERIQVKWGDNLETFNYAEFGLANKKDGKPRRAWKMLTALAGNEGHIEKLPLGKELAALQKRLEELRKLLRARYAIPADPIPHKRQLGYQTSFRIRCNRSFRS